MKIISKTNLNFQLKSVEIINLKKQQHLLENITLVGFKTEIKFGKGDNIKINTSYMYLREQWKENDKIHSNTNCQ